MIISVTSLKGGTGKSTISQNLAVCFAHMGNKVTLIDTDTNGSSLRWSGLRDEELPNVTTVALTEANALRKNINSLHENCDIVIIDGTPALSELVSTIILVANVVLIPIKPGVLDIWATEKFLEKYQNARTLKEELSAYFIVSQYDGRSKLSQEVLEVLESFDVPTLNSKLHNRVAYAECVLMGKGTYEYKDSKAKDEVIQLTNELTEIIENKNT